MRSAVFLFGILLMCSGCAFTVDNEDIVYRPSSAIPVSGASNVTVQVDTSDNRSGNKLQIGAKKNGYGMELAPILSTRPIADIVRDALTDELRRRGYKIGAGGMIVSAEVIRFRSNYEVGFFSADAKSEATMAIQVHTPSGRLLYSKTVTGDGAELNNMVMGGGNTKIALERALPEAIMKVMIDPAFINALAASNVLGS